MTPLTASILEPGPLQVSDQITNLAWHGKNRGWRRLVQLYRAVGRDALGLFLAFFSGQPLTQAAWPPPRPLNEARLAAAGLRIVRSERATLVTDLPAGAEIDRLPRLIDAALPQWAERFGAAPPDDWRLRLYLIREESRFRAHGLWPDQSPEFPHGLSLGHEVWLREQPSDYYRRHLLLHEATHSYMSTRLGSCGPGWYMEGTAELCGTHTLEGDQLKLAAMPASREASPDWGRVRLVRDAVAPRPIAAVLKTDNTRLLPADSYAWAWALCWFLDNHPAYRDRFRALSTDVLSDDFNQRFRTAYREDARQLAKEWRLFASTLVYGHDLEREAIDFSTQATPLVDSGNRRVTIEATRGWQPTGVRVERGKPIRVTATGRYTIARDADGTSWPCEPGGVTLAWHAGRPVGELLATVDTGRGAFTEWEPIGLGAEYMPPSSGVLYLRVNDTPNALADNEGTLEVVIGR